MRLARTLCIALAAIVSLGVAPPPAVKLWRLDGGSSELGNLDQFSDSFAYVGQKRVIPISAYLIRHGDQYLLWDTGLEGELSGKTRQPSLNNLHSMGPRLVEQLASIGVTPDQIAYVALSHIHDDHIGQAADFPAATLLIGRPDLDTIAAGRSAFRLAPWLKGGAKIETVNRDRDVFGDGTVVMLAMPGHTDGHHSLLVRLPHAGPILLSGDVFHFEANRRNKVVPGFNANRADSLASMDRFEAIARNLHARVIIGHELDDVGKLPAFPAAAD